MMKNKTAECIITHMKSVFSRHGIPDEEMCDNMPFFRHKFKEFSKDWELSTKTSSPTYAQSNGQVERTIQTVKKLLKKVHEDGKDSYLCLLEYRNTTVTGMKELPAQILISIRLRTKIPTSGKLLKPKVSRGVKSKLMKRQISQKFYYDKMTSKLPKLKKNDTVRIRKGKEWHPAIVYKQYELPNSFVVKTPDGSTYRRTRHLLKTKEGPPPIIKYQ